MALTQTQLDEAMKPVQFDSHSSVDPTNSVSAVTSPSILPSNSLAVSHGIGPPGPCRLDIHISHNLSAAENDRSLFFEKENHSNESFSHLEDCEAETAASAVAVAAISSDGVSTAQPDQHAYYPASCPWFSTFVNGPAHGYVWCFSFPGRHLIYVLEA
ncbi:hypothetical protein OIU84_029923 [Salix udensis]|uniref:Uncharacterized protein n=1 Tax=Salix udensis TaxID=889485 RepID=A0AAD6KAD6_9ROSI|nr:hypothetical protein OIU84_029923 [Salix udensis]